MRRNFPDIIYKFNSNYTKYVNNVIKEIESYYVEDENIGKLFELLYNDYSQGTIEYYMSNGLNKVLDGMCNRQLLKEDDYEWGYSHYNVVEKILLFINTYLHTSSKTETEQCFGVSLKIEPKKTGNINIIVKSKQFNNEEEMRNAGYTNKAEDILEFLRIYANYKMKDKS